MKINYLTDQLQDMNSKTVIIPKSISEILLYTTVRIIGLSQNIPFSSGTGCFFNIKLDENNSIELILTNKHVIKDAQALSFFFHTAEQVDEEIVPTGEHLNITCNDFYNFWIPHPNPDVDLGALLFSPIRKQVMELLNKTIFYQALEETLILNDKELLEHSTVAEEVLMIGYPIGILDEYNNFPIIRKGITATHPAMDFNNKAMGVVDIACFPGSSGSPILISLEGSYPNKAGGLVLGNKLIFLGLLSCGPISDSEGKIEIVEIPTAVFQGKVKSSQMIHLGYYVKAKEVLNICEHIKIQYKNTANNIT